jgi:O-methyltransferase involved in polyketide biosynthesis
VTENRDVSIAPTAHYTAYVWHRLGLPHADLFATKRGRRLFWTFRFAGEWVAMLLPGVPNMQQYLELRHRAIDWALDAYAPDVVVEIGAGLSRRGLTWASDRGTEYLEVDLPHMIEAKKAAIEKRADVSLQARAKEKLSHHAVDVLSPGFSQFLREQLARGKRRAVIAEGLLGYFDPRDRSRIVKSVAEALAANGGGIFLCDLRAREGGSSVAVAAKVLRAAIWLVTRGRGARQDFRSADEVRAFFAAAGFSSAEPVRVEDATPQLASLRGPARVWRAER